MQYPVTIEGFEVSEIVLETPGIFSGAKLLVNGQPAPKGEKRGQYLLQQDDGTQVPAKLKGSFLDPVPQIVINDKVIKVVEPLKWYQWIWAGLPILLIFIGGFIGAIFGVVATSFSTRVFRSEMSAVLQYVLVGVISIVAVVVYFIIALMISSVL